ncbi:MAG: FAD:protein FMN transferase [Gammaproteobacteria bacterium]|nr:FAD:protein FMN transferase [Gammaproteobacteria bacterium]
MPSVKLEQKENNWYGSFKAMASPCEVIIETPDKAEAERVINAVAAEAWRIEQKFSRYRDDNITFQINHADGDVIEVDDETARLLDFANQLYQISGGMFDVTSGVLRKAWHFDQSDNIPAQQQIDVLLPIIGWDKVGWDKPKLKLAANMEIDLGGIGKEYAVDRCALLARELSDASILINFGGDLTITQARKDGNDWTIGRLSSDASAPVGVIKLKRGALATSGDAHRYLEKDGKRYCHVLNPKTGWPVEDPPHTVSVAAPTCVEAGMLSTMALLQGSKAEEFLKAQEVPYWIN